MASMVAWSVVDRGFEARSDQIEDKTNDICFFSAKHASLRRKSKDKLARIQDGVSTDCCFSQLALYKTN